MSGTNFDRLAESAASQEPVEIWNLESPQLFRTLPYGSSIWSVTFSADGDRVLLGGNHGEVSLWDLTSIHAELRLTRDHEAKIWSVAFSAEGQWIISSGSDRTAKVWDAATGELLDTLDGHTHIVNSAVFSSDGGTIITASADGTAKVWDWDGEEAREIHALKSHRSVCWYATFLPNDEQKVLTVSNDSTVKLWDLTVVSDRR